jgi:dTDP-4-amino-4,6-dideoxygalactose transaminase
MKIPFVDLKLQYQNIKNEIDKAMADVMADTAFIGGSSNKYVTKFEKEFAAFLGMTYVVSCANGTDSLELLLEAYSIGKDDEVIVPALSWISTSEAVGRVGAKPVFVDVCNDTYLMDLEKLESVVTKKTKAIIPVHLYGNALDMPTIMAFSKKHNLIVIEDCAQAHGATYNGQLVGTFGHAASFSFYPGKNLGAYGDAGCIATNSEDIANKCRMIANHGQIQKHNHLMEGRNSRMDGLHAAVLSVKLKYLSGWNESRIRNSETLTKLLAGSSYTCPVKNKNAKHVYHLYVIRHSERDELKQYLTDKQVETAIHYPTPLPLLKAYSKYGYTSADFPVASAQTQQILSIPMFPELNPEQINHLAETLLSFAKQKA